jgi:uncharacterized membrane protein YccC
MHKRPFEMGIMLIGFAQQNRPREFLTGLRLHRQPGGASDEQLNALGYLLNNLRAIDAQLATIESVQTRDA